MLRIALIATLTIAIKATNIHSHSLNQDSLANQACRKYREQKVECQNAVFCHWEEREVRGGEIRGRCIVKEGWWTVTMNIRLSWDKEKDKMTMISLNEYKQAYVRASTPVDDLSGFHS